RSSVPVEHAESSQLRAWWLGDSGNSDLDVGTPVHRLFGHQHTEQRSAVNRRLQWLLQTRGKPGARNRPEFLVRRREPCQVQPAGDRIDRKHGTQFLPGSELLPVGFVAFEAFQNY